MKSPHTRFLLPIGLGSTLALFALFAASWSTRAVAVLSVPQIATRYVATSGSDTTSCSDANTPCATIQYALDQSDPGDEIRVAGGTYTGVHPYEGVFQMIYISKTITIRGGFTVTNWIEPDPVVNPTILDAEGLGRVIYAIGPLSLTVEGVQITGGLAAPYDGGGVYLLECTALFIGNHFTNNVAEQDGGAIHADYSHLTLWDNILDGNSASNGGGLYGLATHIHAERNIFAGNTVSGWGGAIRLDVGSWFTATNNLIVDNQAGTLGAGLFSDTNQPIHLIHNTLSNNQGGSGIGIFTLNNAWLTNTIFVSHTIGMFVYDGVTAHLEATLWGNETDWAGGGTVLTGTHNLYGSPSFIDPANGDYHLGLQSIALNAGIDAGVTTDFEGDTRPSGTGFDLGADEFLGEAELHLSKTAHAQEIFAGNFLTYTLRVTNTGTMALQAWITDTLPGTVTPTGILTWTALILPNQVWSQSFYVASSAIYSGTITNTMTVTTEEGVLGTAIETVTVTIPVVPAFRQFLSIVNRP